MNPAATHQIIIGERNLADVREFMRTHLCATQRECADFLGIGVMAVNRHVKTLRKEWRVAELERKAAELFLDTSAKGKADYWMVRNQIDAVRTGNP